MSFTPTPSQTKALSRERHLAIVANAGSGKTQVLVTRYLDLLEINATLSARNVVAITFTENAASELAGRITRELNERLSISEGDRLRRLRQIEEGLSGAVITTIHGFAARVLRAYPVEAGIDAAFGIIQGPDQKLLLEDSITRVFYSLLEHAYSQEEPSAVLQAFRTFGRRDITSIVRTLLSNRTRASRIRKLILDRPEDDVIDEWYQAACDELSWLTGSGLSALAEALLGNFKDGKVGQAAESAAHRLLSATANDRLPAAKQFIDSLLTGKGALRKKVVTEEAELQFSADFDQLWRIVSDRMRLLDMLTAGKDDFHDKHRDYLALVRTCFEIYDEVLLDYDQAKSDYAQLDFDDLLILLHKILGESRVREDLAAQYPHVMIDEYQDTDETQFEIAQLLTLNFSTSTKLTIVGDPKQSIYRFRNADVEVFDETCRAIEQQTLTPSAEAEAIALGLQPTEERGVVALRESFRMAKAPLAFINELFRVAMQDGAGYLDLVHASSCVSPGTVTLAFGTKSEDDADAITESTYIARKIKATVGTVEVDTKQGRSPARFRDCAILLRKRTNLLELETALRAEGVPFVVMKGTGFFAQQEVLDAIAYLRFLANPADDVSLVGVLRSPFFAVSDQELFQISHFTRIRKPDPLPTFWQQVLAYPASRHTPSLKRALADFEALLPLVGRTTSAFLLERLYALSGIVAAVGSLPGGEQKIRNLDKLLQMAREADRSGFSSLFDFVERLSYLVSESENEPQADISDDGNAVQIMTVHAAKGLEFPIVFVPFIGAAVMNDRGVSLDKRLGLRLPYRKDEPRAITELIDLRASREAEAESIRLLYVALTRAKEHLILTATQPDKKNSSWFFDLRAALPQLELGMNASFATTIECYDANTRQTSLEQFPLTVTCESFDTPLAQGNPLETTALPPVTKYNLELLAIVNPVGSYSATQFLTLKECPTEYHLRYALGLPQEPKLASDDEPFESAERIRGSLLGQIAHLLLERFESYSSGAEIDDDRFAEVCERIAPMVRLYTDDERGNLFEEARKHVQTFLRSNVSTFIRSADFSKAEFELQYLLPTGDKIFGILDRVFTLPDGIWAILDFKTDALTPKSRELKIARYRSQLLFYAYLLSKYAGVSRISASLFFTRSGDHVTFEFTDDDFDDLEQQFAEMIAQVRANERATDLDSIPRDTTHCAECAYFTNGACIVEHASLTSERLNQKPTAIPAM